MIALHWINKLVVLSDLCSLSDISECAAMLDAILALRKVIGSFCLRYLARMSFWPGL